MNLTGQKSYLITDYGFYHKQSATCETIITKDNWNYCEGYYKSKWGGLPGEELYTHPFNNKNNKIDHWVKGGQ
jgi:hypothetical protein